MNYRHIIVAALAIACAVSIACFFPSADAAEEGGASSDSGITVTTPETYGIITGYSADFTITVSSADCEFSEVEGGSASSWLDIDSSGHLTGVAPDVVEISDQLFLYSVMDSSGSTSEFSLLVSVYPVLNVVPEVDSYTESYHQSPTAVYDEIRFFGNVPYNATILSDVSASSISFDNGHLTIRPDVEYYGNVVILFESAEGPYQTFYVEFPVTIYREEPDLLFDIGNFADSYAGGADIDIAFSSNVMGTEISLSGSAAGFLSIVDGHIVGQVPYYTDPMDCTLTVSVSTPSGQSETLQYTFDIVPTFPLPDPLEEDEGTSIWFYAGIAIVAILIVFIAYSATNADGRRGRRHSRSSRHDRSGGGSS